MRYVQLVLGPAGSGKSTYCSNLVLHGKDIKRTINVVNLDPAAESFSYDVIADIRELIDVQDVMEADDLHFGPNGGLIFCMEYLIEHVEWLKEQLGDDDEDYILFDCPGQIELYTHMNVMNQLVKALQMWDFKVCAVFLLDSHFMVEPNKFLSGTLTALSVMVNLEVPHVNVLTKIDMLSKSSKKHLDRFLAVDTTMLLESGQENSVWAKKYEKLTQIIGKIIDDFSMISYFPLDISDEESFENLLEFIDIKCLQFGEDADVKTRDFEEPDADQDCNGFGDD